ncbi:hypothetical protein [Bacillus sp. JJ722]|uniref:hypothetical protein n=1 Tax=Bacillus sp. JJ722 TaxID=3122973 RepID=UPI002FFD59B9
MEKMYKIQPDSMHPFNWNGFLECVRHCNGTLHSIHLHTGESIEIQSKLEFEGPFTLTRKSKDLLNMKIRASHPLILKDLTSHLDKGYMIIKAELNQYDMARWQSYKFNATVI